MSTILDKIQIQINILQNERNEAEEKFNKYQDVITRLDDILYRREWFTDKSIAHKIEYISDHYIGSNGVYDRMERNPESAEGKFMLLFDSRERQNRAACEKNLLEIQESYAGIVRGRNHAAVMRDEYLHTVASKDQEIQRQQQAYRAQEERERREREEAARRAEQQRAAQEAAERLAAAQQTVNAGRARRQR